MLYFTPALFHTCFIISSLVQTDVKSLVLGSILMMKEVASFCKKTFPFQGWSAKTIPY